MQLSGASASRESGQEGTHGIAPEVLARLSAANDHAVFAAAWLDAIASLTDGMQQGLVVLAALPGGRNEPVASWPSKVVPEGALLAVVDGAVRGGRMVLQSVDPREGHRGREPLACHRLPSQRGRAGSRRGWPAGGFRCRESSDRY